MDTATLPKDSVQNDKRCVSIELLNSTLKATSYLGKKGEPTKNQHLSTLVEREALMRNYNQFTQTERCQIYAMR